MLLWAGWFVESSFGERNRTGAWFEFLEGDGGRAGSGSRATSSHFRREFSAVLRDAGTHGTNVFSWLTASCRSFLDDGPPLRPPPLPGVNGESVVDSYEGVQGRDPTYRSTYGTRIYLLAVPRSSDPTLPAPPAPPAPPTFLTPNTPPAIFAPETCSFTLHTGWNVGKRHTSYAPSCPALHHYDDARSDWGRGWGRRVCACVCVDVEISGGSSVRLRPKPVSSRRQSHEGLDTTPLFTPFFFLLCSWGEHDITTCFQSALTQRFAGCAGERNHALASGVSGLTPHPCVWAKPRPSPSFVFAGPARRSMASATASCTTSLKRPRGTLQPGMCPPHGVSLPRWRRARSVCQMCLDLHTLLVLCLRVGRPRSACEAPGVSPRRPEELRCMPRVCLTASFCNRHFPSRFLFLLLLPDIGAAGPAA